MSLGENEKALTVLEKYTELAVGDIYPIKLKGDDYFDLLEEWFERSLSLGAYPPRDESVIRHSMTQAVTENPAFHDLAEEPHFRDMVQRLKKNEDCV